VIGDSPGGMNTYADNQMPSGIIGGGGGGRREARYCPVKTTDPSSSGDGDDLVRYKSCEPAGLPKRIHPSGFPMRPCGLNHAGFNSFLTDYGGEDVCPYATFQLPEKAPGRPLLNKGEPGKKFGYHTGETMYNVGNVYSGPYHSLDSPGFHYNQAPTMQMRVIYSFIYSLSLRFGESGLFFRVKKRKLSFVSSYCCWNECVGGFPPGARLHEGQATA